MASHHVALTVTFQALTYLSSWHVFFFQQKAIVAESKFEKHACKTLTAIAKNPLYLLLSTAWFDYW